MCVCAYTCTYMLRCALSSHSDIDDCQLSPCHTDATCLDHVNNFTCVCQPGFTGQLCDQGKFGGVIMVWFMYLLHEPQPAET